MKRALLALTMCWVLAAAAAGQTPSKAQVKDKKKGVPASAPMTGNVGSIFLTSSPAQATGTKVVMAELLFGADGVKSQRVVASYGAPTSGSSGARDFVFRLVSTTGKPLAEYGVWDPRKAVVEKQGIVTNPSGTQVAKFAFHPDAAEIQVIGEDGAVLLKVPVREVMKEFCSRLKTDKECLQLQ